MEYYNDLLNALNGLEKTIINRTYTPSGFVSLITRTINKVNLPTKVYGNIVPLYCDFKHQKRIKKIDKVYIGGFFYEEDDEEDGDKSIQLVWHFPEHQKKSITITKKWWNVKKLTIIDTVEHELVHLQQARIRDYIDTGKILVNNPRKELDYFSNTDEIQSYGLNIARSLWRKYGEKSFDYIKKISYTDKYDYLKLYRQKFKTYPKVKHELYKWIYFYLKEFENG